MTRIPLSYSLRSMMARKLTTGLSVTGIALVVFVFTAVLMLAHGLQKTLVATGDPLNALIIRKGTDSELLSGVTRDAASMINTLPQIATGSDSKPVSSSEVVVIINLRKTGSHDMGNVTVRGVSGGAFQLRPAVKLTEGRLFQPGSREIIIGSAIAKQFEGVIIGEKTKFGGDTWTIVGVFEANGTGFDSEIWGDVEQLLAAFNRLGAYSSVTVRLNDTRGFADLQKALESDQRFQQVNAVREPEYYAKQSEVMAAFIRILGIAVTIIFSIGAVIGAMMGTFTGYVEGVLHDMAPRR
ncbi:MAG: ABC transporter permease [bacterium]